MQAHFSHWQVKKKKTKGKKNATFSDMCNNSFIDVIRSILAWLKV